MRFNKEHFILILSLVFLIPAITLLFLVNYDGNMITLIFDAVLFEWKIKKIVIWRLFLFTLGISLLITYLVFKIKKMIRFLKSNKK